MRVLGIDCGSEYTGYGVVEETAERKLVCHVNGAIKLKSGTPMAAKLEKIFADLTAIIAKHQPEVMAIEDVFYAVNVKSALKLGQVRGVAMLAASSSGLQVSV
jgi:crossover junction endodeoxyribonuclease RuvC